MQLDKYSRRIIHESDLIKLLYNNPTTDLSLVYLDDPNKHNHAIAVNYSYLSKINELLHINLTVEDWHKQNQTNWHMPEEYKNFDIAAWILNECRSNENELQRCGQELLEYSARDLLPLLQYLKYLVDTMRKNNVVWGVGRGSSTASFVLYKIGVHRINSIEYQLPLEEFFKELLDN